MTKAGGKPFGDSEEPTGNGELSGEAAEDLMSSPLVDVIDGGDTYEVFTLAPGWEWKERIMRLKDEIIEKLDKPIPGRSES